MKNILICGAGGFATEVVLAIEDINKAALQPVWNILGYFDENEHLHGQKKNGYTVLGGDEVVLHYKQEVHVCITISNPVVRKKIYENLSQNAYVKFPNIIHPSAIIYYDHCRLGIGNIIFLYTILSSNVSLGNFNVVNSYSGLGHDVVIGDYNTLNPRVAISGGVTIENLNEFGMCSSIVQNKKVGSSNLIGAHSLLLRSIKNNNTYFGLPAMKVSL